LASSRAQLSEAKQSVGFPSQRIMAIGHTKLFLFREAYGQFFTWITTLLDSA
jgi:hypothetical protein